MIEIFVELPDHHGSFLCGCMCTCGCKLVLTVDGARLMAHVGGVLLLTYLIIDDDFSDVRVKDCWRHVRREGVGAKGDQKTRFTHVSVANHYHLNEDKQQRIKGWEIEQKEMRKHVLPTLPSLITSTWTTMPVRPNWLFISLFISLFIGRYPAYLALLDDAL